MPFIPLPFVVMVVLAALLARVAWSGNGAGQHFAFTALIAVCAVQSGLLGLRWGYGVEHLRPLLPIVAAAIPPLLHASFSELVREEQSLADKWSPFAAALLVALLVTLLPAAIDIVLLLIYGGSAAALLWLAWQGPDALALARFESAETARLAIFSGAIVLLASALVDLAVLADLRLLGGENAAAIIGVANAGSLLLVAFAAVVAKGARVSGKTDEPVAVRNQMNEAETQAVMARIEELLEGRQLFRDVDLNLNRLARRAGITARRISNAVNRSHGRNVSQYINGFRIKEACRLLETTKEPVTKIMFDAGFQTKSNFNREFLRVTGMSPAAWRDKASRSHHETATPP